MLTQTVNDIVMIASISLYGHNISFSIFRLQVLRGAWFTEWTKQKNEGISLIIQKKEDSEKIHLTLDRVWLTVAKCVHFGPLAEALEAPIHHDR